MVRTDPVPTIATLMGRSLVAILSTPCYLLCSCAGYSYSLVRERERHDRISRGSRSNAPPITDILHRGRALFTLE